MEISKKVFGVLSNGEEIYLYTLKAGELIFSLSTLGATWTSLFVPSKAYGMNDVLLGYSSLDSYIENKNFFGTTVGRFANRICGAEFSVDNQKYKISENKVGCSLHGGKIGFSRKNWKSEAYLDKDAIFVRFELESPDGDQGYPGNLKAVVTYGLTENNEVVSIYEAEVDKKCPINLTNHAYFNLFGEDRNKDILSTELKLYSSAYAEVNDALIPTGRMLSTIGTAMDFQKRRPIGKERGLIFRGNQGGYDHCYQIDGNIGELRAFAELFEPVTGRCMQGYTTLPGVQVYTGNMLKSERGKNGSVYKKNFGICLETQYFPDSPNQRAFPCAIFGPDRKYKEKTILMFSW